jgi:hypothetical protein
VPDQLRLFTEPQAVATSDDYYTPKWVFDALGEKFDLDVCAPPGGGPFVPTERYYTQEEDGLASEWSGFVWMNPPYSKPLPWVIKFLDHGNGVALLPTSNAKWLKLLWDGASGWLALPSMKFYTPNGLAKGTIPTQCWLVSAGDKGLEALQRTKLGRVR